MKKKIAAIVMFIFVLVFPMVAWPLLDYVDNTELEENREPAKYPNFSNSFFTDFDKYFLEQIPIRNSMIRFYKMMEDYFGRGYEKILNLLNLNYYREINNVIFGEEDWLFYFGDNSLGYYRGTNLPSEGELKSYVNKAEKVDKYFRSQGKEFKIFIAPNKEQMYSEYMPKGIKEAEGDKRIDKIVNYFKENSTVEVVYAKDALLSQKKESQVYYKQDTHWNKAGAHIGAIELLNSLGIASQKVAFEEIKHNAGDLANMIARPAVEDVDYNYNYKPEIQLQISSSDAYHHESESTNPNSKNLLMLGDSFRISMIETLGKEFSNSKYYHRMVYNANNRLENEFNEADVIVVQAVERYDNDIFGAGGVLDRIIALNKL